MGKLLSVKLDGFDEIANGLRALPDALGESALRQVAVAGARVILDEAVLRAPVKSGVLRSSIIMKHIDELSDGANHQTYYVTVRSGTRTEDGKKDTSNDAYYWRWVEEGHRYVPRATNAGVTTYTQRLRNGKVVTRTRKYSGTSLRARRRAADAMEVEFGNSRVGAKPFMRPAFEARVADALSTAKKKMTECVQKAFAEMSR